MVGRIDCLSWFMSPLFEVALVTFLFLAGTRVLPGGREPHQVCPLSGRASCQHPLPLTLPYPALCPLETLCVFSETFKPQGDLEKLDIGALWRTTEGLRGQGAAETRWRLQGPGQALLGVRRSREQGYLCRQEEDLIRDVPDPAGDDSQGHAGEHVGVVALPGKEGPAILQSHAWERTSAGKDPSALGAGREPETELGDGLRE